MNTTTIVGSYEITVRRASHPSVRFFISGAHGKKEAGLYAFWTVVLNRKGKNRVWGRALTSLQPGDRFDRMRTEMRTAKSKKARDAYRRIWKEIIKGGKLIRYIRPSTEKEIKLWMDGHKSDAKFARRVKVLN